MDAKPLPIGKIMSERQRFIVPIYQRTYTWTIREQLDPFFFQMRDKAVEFLTTGKVAFSHYMGALLLIPEGSPVFGKIQVFNVVDGQQRLSTFHLCFAALRDIARDYNFPDIAKNISDLILHSAEVPMEAPEIERYKLEPTAYDRELFRDIIDLSWQDLMAKYPDHFYRNGNLKNTTPKPLAAFWHFWKLAEEFMISVDNDDDVEVTDEYKRRRLLALSTVLFEHFRLIVITLDKDDDAQVIFQTLNSGGKPLAAMDLVRNDLFHRAIKRGENQDHLMKKHWITFEQEFWKQEQTQGRIKKPRIDFFLSHVLAAEQGTIISLGELYSEYKSFVARSAFENTTAEMETLTKYVPTYKALIEPPAVGPLARLARRLNTFDVSTAYPLIFVIGSSNADDAQKERLYDLVASYVIRRALCSLNPKNYNKVFVDVAAYLRTNGVGVAQLAAAFGQKTGDTGRFPTDEELATAIKINPQYTDLPQNRLRLILEEIEFASRDKFNVDGTLQSGLSIEHVLPQGWEREWPLEDGRLVGSVTSVPFDEMTRTLIENRKTFVHRLGNLTLLTLPRIHRPTTRHSRPNECDYLTLCSR